MRYYDIIIADPSGASGSIEWTSYPNGNPDPGALLVEFDVPTVFLATPAGNSLPVVTVWGVTLGDIARAKQFGATGVPGKITSPGWNIQVFGGMGGGLPLENPKQRGLLFQGMIWQSWGNWQGTEQNLNFLLTPTASGFLPYPGNIVFQWSPGQSFASAVQATVYRAFPNMTLTVNVSPNLSTPNVQTGKFSSLQSFATKLKSVTIGLLGEDYPGVDIVIRRGQILITDGTTAQSPKIINFVDMIGQPVWSGFAQLQVQTVLRADINVGDYVQLPQGLQDLPGQAVQTVSSFPGLKSNSTFQGAFVVIGVRHVGNFRSPHGDDWITVLTCTPPPSTAGSVLGDTVGASVT